LLVSALAWAGADPLVDLEVSPRGGCGRTAAGAVRCWSHDEEVARPVEGVDARRGLMVAPSQAFACAVGAAPGVSCWGPAAGGLELGPLAAATAVLPIRYGDDVCARVAEGVRCVWNGGFSWVSETERLSREGPHVLDALGRVQVVSLYDRSGAAFCWVDRTTRRPRCGGYADLAVLDASPSLYHSCGIAAADRSLVCWNGGMYGSDAWIRGEPRHFPLKPLAQLEGGSVARASDGRLWAFGWTVSGFRRDPEPLPDRRFVEMDAWRDGVCGVDARGTVSCAGNFAVTTPRRVRGVPPLVELAAGGDATCGVARDGVVWCWGSFADADEPATWVPQERPEARGWSHLALEASGNGWSLCGLAGGRARCTVRSVLTSERATVELPVTGAREVSLSGSTACALGDGDRLSCIAHDGRVGELVVPGAVHLVAVAHRGTFVTTRDGGLRQVTMGDAGLAVSELGPLDLTPDRGPFADGEWLDAAGRPRDRVGTPDPRPPADPGGHTLVSLATRCGLTAAGGLACDDGVAYRAVTGGPPRSVALVGGERHWCALDADGGAWCWGARESGQLGDGFWRDVIDP
jgi:hypothetical protein